MNWKEIILGHMTVSSVSCCNYQFGTPLCLHVTPVGLAVRQLDQGQWGGRGGHFRRWEDLLQVFAQQLRAVTATDVQLILVNTIKVD